MGKWGYVTTAASQETPFVVFDGICSIFKDWTTHKVVSSSDVAGHCKESL
jgi:hypothetical protein